MTPPAMLPLMIFETASFPEHLLLRYECNEPNACEAAKVAANIGTVENESVVIGWGTQPVIGEEAVNIE